MADDERTTAEETPGAPTMYDVGWGARAEAPRVLRELPQIVRNALRIVWAAGRRQFVITTLLQAVNSAGLLIALLLGRDVLNGVLAANAAGSGYGDVLPRALLAVAVIGAFGFATAVGWEQQQILTELVGRDTQARLLDVACGVDLLAFDRPAFHDRLARAQTQRHSVHQIVFGIGGVVGALLGVLAALVALLTIAPLLLPLGLLGLIPLVLVSGRRAHRFWLFAFRMTPRDRERDYLASMLTTRPPAAEVRAFDLLAPLRARHDRLYDERIVELTKVARRQLAWSLASSVATLAVAASLLGAVGYLVASDRMSLAEAGVGAAAIVLLMQRLGAAGFSANSLFESALFVQDYTSFLAIGAEERAAAARGAIDPGRFAEVVTDGLQFRYPGSERPALDGVDVVVRAGETIALVGENGSGKTTLAKLLAGLYLPTGGALRFNGVDVATLDPARVRAQVTILFQDFVQWSLSARDNVELGRHERAGDEARLRRALDAGGAEEVVRSLRDGLETQLGPQFEGGTELSGGQWQRIALARAFFRDAPLVILDEPTSALDARAENALFERVADLLDDRAVVLVSHRFSTVRSADRIYVLHDGHVVEHGSHDELMGLGGTYAELYTLQARAFVDS